jgi:hypothetical protein
MYPDGTAGIPAGDGCNTCSCKGGVIVCSTQVCTSSCVVNGVVYPEGSVGVPDPYSCNSCTCKAGMIAGCTEIFCPLSTPCFVGRAIYQDGFGYVSADGSTRCQCSAGVMSCSAVP